MPLPLKLAPFERLLYGDDRDAYPMAFHIRLWLSGEIEIDAFRRCVEQTIERHPLLRARVCGEKFGEMTWEAAPDSSVLLDVGPLGEPLLYPDGRERIDLERESGVRIWVRHGQGKVMLNFQFHHACGDGIGAYRVIEDIFALYDRMVRPGKTSAVLRPISPERLRTRTALDIPRWKRWLQIPQELWGLTIGLFLYFHIKPVDMPAPVEPKPQEVADELLEMPSCTFDVAETKLLRRAARAAKATVNDVLLRDTLSAMHRWVQRVDPQLEKRYLRVMVPVNLRGRRDDEMPCTNVVGMVFIDRKVHRCKTRRRLLYGIKTEMSLLKTFRLATSYPRACQVLSRLLTTQRLEALDASTRCYATTALSNMGRAFFGHRLRTQDGRPDGRIVVGAMVLERITSAPPVRHKSSTSLTALSYDGCLTIAMNYDRRHFTRQAAGELFESLVGEVRRTIDDFRKTQESNRAVEGEATPNRSVSRIERRQPADDADAEEQDVQLR